MKIIKNLLCLSISVFMLVLAACNFEDAPYIGITSAPGDAASQNGTGISYPTSSASGNESGTAAVSDTNTSNASQKSGTASSGKSSSNNTSQGGHSGASQNSPSTSFEMLSSAPSSSGKNYKPLADSRRYAIKNGGLSSLQVKLYGDIKNAAAKQQKSLNLGYYVTKTDVALVMQCVMCDYPEYYWMTGKYSISIGQNDVSINFEYLSPHISYSADSAALSAVIEDFYNSLPDGLSEYELELAAHDFICKKVEYDYNTANGSKNNPYTYSSYGALVKGNCVCEGYSRAMQLLMHRVGIECGLINGTAGGSPHMWNIIKISRNWYHLDVTWDDVSPAVSTDISCYHLFFNLTASQIADTDHSMDPVFSSISDLISIDISQSFNISIQPCTVTTFNFFIKENTYLNGSSEQSIIQAAIKNALENGKNHCEFFADSKSAFNNINNNSSQQESFSNIIAPALKGKSSYSLLLPAAVNGRFVVIW